MRLQRSSYNKYNKENKCSNSSTTAKYSKKIQRKIGQQFPSEFRQIQKPRSTAAKSKKKCQIENGLLSAQDDTEYGTYGMYTKHIGWFNLAIFLNPVDR